MTATSTGVNSDFFTASATVHGQECWFWGIVVNTDGTNNGTITVFDGNPGVRKMRIVCVGADFTYGAILYKPIRITDLLRFTLSGGNAEVEVIWEQKHGNLK